MLNPWYVTGFCDGEAAFTYSHSGRAFSLYFSIKQREDNRQIVEEIQQFFNFVGSIYKVKESLPTKNSGFTKPSIYYRVGRIDELGRIIEHFDKYPLQSRKKEVYDVWRQMAMHKIENYRNTDYDKLRALAEKLSNLNQKSRAFKVHTR
jgi:hypothetical protein